MNNYAKKYLHLEEEKRGVQESRKAMGMGSIEASFCWLPTHLANTSGRRSFDSAQEDGARGNFICGEKSGGAGFFESLFLVHSPIGLFQEFIEGFHGMWIGGDVAKTEAEERFLCGAGVAQSDRIAEAVNGNIDGGLTELTGNGELIATDTAEDVGLTEGG